MHIVLGTARLRAGSLLIKGKLHIICIDYTPLHCQCSKKTYSQLYLIRDWLIRHSGTKRVAMLYPQLYYLIVWNFSNPLSDGLTGAGLSEVDCTYD